jgi:hypothetical protein
MKCAPAGRSFEGVRTATWMDRNLAVQGYRLEADERRRLRLGLRFATGLCLPLVALAMVLESPANHAVRRALAVAGLFAIGASAAALALGGLLLVACSLTTVANSACPPT